MDKRFAYTILAVLLVAGGAAALASRSEAPEAEPLHEVVSGVERPPASQESVPRQEDPPAYSYLIREYQGRVAVFSADDQEAPQLVLNTLVKYLPDYDRGQLEQGIPVEDYQDLVALIEDFTS